MPPVPLEGILASLKFGFLPCQRRRMDGLDGRLWSTKMTTMIVSLAKVVRIGLAEAIFWLTIESFKVSMIDGKRERPASLAG